MSKTHPNSTPSSGDDSAKIDKSDRNQFYHQLFDIVNDAIFIHDIESGQILDVNRKMMEMFCCTYEQALQYTVGDLSSDRPPCSQKKALEWIHKASTLGPQLFEWHSKDRNGRLFWVEVNLKRAVIGGQDRMVAIVRDISERKKVEQELAKSQALFLAAIEQNPAGILLADAGLTKIYMANQAALDILDETPQSIAQYSLATPPHNWQATRPNGTSLGINELPLVQAVLEGKAANNVEMIIRRQDGRQRWILANAAPIRDDNGNIIAGIVVFPDITNLKQAEQKQRRLMKELKAKNEELESIIYVTSHDLRSPVVNIMGFSRELTNAYHTVSDIIKRMPLTPEDQKTIEPLFEKIVPESLMYIESCSLKIEMLLDGLLKISRVGKAPLDLTAIDMNQMIDNIINTMQYHIHEHKAKVTVEPLPSCRADSGQISQVFANLLDNALKYQHRPDGGTIHITGRREKNASLYCVADNGPGIPKERHKQIFELFHRLCPDGPVKGEGLGLTIVRRIIDRHHGDIWLESQPNEGSRFYILLPDY